MKVSDFDFELPKELIAQEPIEPRDKARLLYIGSTLNDLCMTNLPEILDHGDMLVFNDTKVIPARLIGTRDSIKFEVTLHKELKQDIWLAFARGARRLKVGDYIEFAKDFSCKILQKRLGGEILLLFCHYKGSFDENLAKHGFMPLPPYIKRNNEVIIDDFQAYQTLFAKRSGAVACPTAGLHFTRTLMDRLKQHGIKIAFVTLHIGAGTFLPVKAKDTADHRMHSEWGEVKDEVAQKINQTRAEGGKIIAVGSTSLRLLETAADEFGNLRPFSGETNIFIVPGYNFKVVDSVLTNFHLPRSTLMMLVSALAGKNRIMRAYQHAILKGYRFFSYGDASLIEKRQ